MAGPGNILIKIGAEAGQALSELSKTNKALGDTMTTSEKMGAGLKKAALPAAAALTAIGFAAVDATKAAMEDAAAQEHLSGVLERTAGATQKQIAATEDWISGISRATGVADDQLRPALEKIVTATGDVTKGQEYLQAALDISAASGKDLDTVSVAIAKGYTGQTAALSKLVPGLSEAAKSSKDFGVIMAELGDKTGGAMADSAETAAGKMKILSNQTAELQESLGMALIPAVEMILPLLSKFADFAAENTTAIKILIGVVATFAGGIIAANAAMKAITVATQVWQGIVKVATALQWLWNTAILANPLVAITALIIALGAAFIIAYQRSETFRRIVDGALDAVKDAVASLRAAFDRLWDVARDVWNWIASHWKVGLFAFGPIGAAIYLLVTNFNTLKSTAGAVADAIADAIGGITGAIQGVIGAVESLIHALGRIKVPSIHLPNLPGPFVAPAAAGVSSFASAPATTTVNVYGSIDPEGTARAIRRILDQHDRRQGR